MEKSEFDRLLERYLNDNVTEQERLKIEAWLNVAKTKRADDQELDKEAEDRLFRKITGNLDKLDELVTLEPPSRKHADITQWTLRLAAALLVLAIVIYGVRYVQYEYQQTEHVAVGSQVDKLILSDGSLV